MQKKEQIIFHLIDTLSQGGAELLLKNTLHLLPQFQHVVIYLSGPHTLAEDFKKEGAQLICLEHNGWSSMPRTVLKIKRIVSQMQPVLVHTHLFYSTLFARLAIGGTVPLVSTLHSLYSKDAFEKNRKSLYIEKLTLQKRHTLIAVSKFVLQDYLQHIPFRGQKFVLYNFIPRSYFKQQKNGLNHGTLKCVAIGNLKEAKNYSFLLSVFTHLKNTDLSLDIYGSGPLEKELKSTIEREKLNARLCGSIDDVSQVIHQYQLFFQASAHEGFGLSVIEAMAAGLPLFVSDIPVFKEVTNGFANFFPLDDAAKAAELIKNAIKDKSGLQQYADKAFLFAEEHYSEETYIRSLLHIYSQVTNNKILATTCVE